MNIFTNPDEVRLRAGWRLAAQFFLMYFIGFLLILMMNLAFSVSGPVIQTVAFAIGAAISIGLAARGLDLRPWGDFGLAFNPKSYRECVYGFALAGLVIGLIFVIEFAAGWLTVSGFGWQQYSNGPFLFSFVGYLLFMILVGVYEEMVFRGYQIVNLSEGLNGERLSRTQAVAGAVFLTSLVFGMMHALNPNASWISTLFIIIAGIMLAYPFIVTGRLAWSIGLHIGWNFFQGGVFGFPVSGVPGRASLLQINQKGPDLLTGGGFGPEAGLIGLFGMIIIVVLLTLFFRRSDGPMAVHANFGIYRSSPRQNSE